ncbi:hypothetical protein NBV64_05900 [Alcaligenes sp. DN25]|uniref:hypothetical protein n=1 Tax=Alcaligenes TaxID=507 RepID=UPI00202E10C1|nr:MULTISPECIES: hypothetical protein [Alcaligenes]URW83885.1 hypothetical protein NBV64_05900 [Alcaligenes sp. DN25]WEA68723.1 hypothetical protein PWH35_05910 [Alcaligenes faecalis]
MTVSSEQSRIQYATDGVAISFPVPFRFLSGLHLRVSFAQGDDDAVELVPGRDFDAVGAGNPSGGTVTTYTAYPAGGSIAIERVVPITQETAYQRNDPFPERAHEQALDKLTMICQMLGSYFGLTPGSIRRALLLGKHDRDGHGAYQARNNRITDLADPHTDTDAVNRRSMFSFVVEYVDRAIAGVSGGFGWFLQKGLGAIYRPFQDKMRDVVSVRDYIATPVDGETSNQEGIVAAVAAAIELGANLNWPAADDDYISTENIPGFHRVRHIGRGVIRRGANRWHISPGDADTNTLHVAVSGLELNDGLSPDNPLEAKAAMAALLNCGPVLNGDWIVSFAAGDYQSLSLSLPNVKMAGKKLLKLVGPPVSKMSQPLATLDGLGKISFGIRAGGHNCVELRDIFLTRYREYGFNGSGQGLWFLNNVHTRDCRTGIGGENNGLLFVSGGVHDLTAGFSTSSAETHRILSRFLVKHAIGYSYDENTGNPIMDPPEHMPVLRGNARSGGSRGMLAQELATGHVNADVSEFAYGIDARVSSRVHLDANSIVKKNSIGVRARYGCDVQIQPDVDFGLGTTDENLTDNVVFEGGTDTVFSQSFAYLEQRVAVNKVTHTVTGTTTAKTVGGTLHTLRARDFKSDGGLRLRLSGVVLGASGRKTFSLISRNSTVASAVVPTTETGQFVMELSSRVKSPGAQQSSSWFVIGGGSGSPGSSSCRALPTALPWGALESPLSLRVELENAADSVVIEHIELWRLG